MTIIEKFEYYARSCSFAFILMTPDDRTIGITGAESLWRARQNVIMELGWFMAHLGRERVVILSNGRLEIPSDILGIVYVEFNNSVLEAVDRIHLALQRVELLERTQAFSRSLNRIVLANGLPNCCTIYESTFNISTAGCGDISSMSKLNCT
jgi:hypothetical protein